MKPQSGESIDEAIIIVAEKTGEGIRKEYEYLERKFGVHDVDWQCDAQHLAGVDGKYYDEIDILLPDGKKKTIYFDITSWFGK